jgi:glycosyltransferase involved in cell wall biosynthesis
MKIVLCWTNFSGYVAACWRELAAQSGLELAVICYQPETTGQTAFDNRLLASIPHTLVSKNTRNRSAAIADLVAAEHPDIVVIPGWADPAYCRLVTERRLASAQFIMAMDTPYRGDPRQWASRLLLRRFLRRLSRVVVSGERSFVYARRLGFSDREIMQGTYAYDQQLFDAAAIDRRLALANGWPRRFLYMGRYAREKAIDVLVQAYRLYRRATPSPWRLDCYGMGDLSRLLREEPGVTDHGFVQPTDQPKVLDEHGCLILPSRYEPWGVVVAEAMATGMPAICSTACGASSTLVMSYYNGLLVPPDDAPSLARAMHWIDEHRAELPEFGRRAAVMAAGCAASVWAIRWRHLFEDVIRDRDGRA